MATVSIFKISLINPPIDAFDEGMSDFGIIWILKKSYPCMCGGGYLNIFAQASVRLHLEYRHSLGYIFCLETKRFKFLLKMKFSSSFLNIFYCNRNLLKIYILNLTFYLWPRRSCQPNWCLTSIRASSINENSEAAIGLNPHGEDFDVKKEN